MKPSQIFEKSPDTQQKANNMKKPVITQVSVVWSDTNKKVSIEKRPGWIAVSLPFGEPIPESVLPYIENPFLVDDVDEDGKDPTG